MLVVYDIHIHECEWVCEGYTAHGMSIGGVVEGGYCANKVTVTLRERQTEPTCTDDTGRQTKVTKNNTQAYSFFYGQTTASGASLRRHGYEMLITSSCSIREKTNVILA